MRLFHCDHCGHIVFFESVQCVHCGATLAYLPDYDSVVALEHVEHQINTPPEAGIYHRYGAFAKLPAGATEVHYRMCANRVQYQACSFALHVDDPQALCSACRQTLVVPDLSVPGNMLRWQKLESAKRLLYYSLAKLGLHPEVPYWSPHYQFLADTAYQLPVMTGHNNGVITINIAEADDEERVRRRVALHEPYRTLLGHLRHETGHFFWDRLIRDGGELESFRQLFGDERQDYQQALDRYYYLQPNYEQWSSNHVSAYASAHPWEDWAESWAHYLHMVDALETAASYQTQLAIPVNNATQTVSIQDPFTVPPPNFSHMVAQWMPMTLMLNSMNRSLGQQDAYPFTLSGGALQKLRYVHELIHRPHPLSPPVLAQ